MLQDVKCKEFTESHAKNVGNAIKDGRKAYAALYQGITRKMMEHIWERDEVAQ